MTLLPDVLVALSKSGAPLEGSSFVRVDPSSAEARQFSEANWDEIICANVAALTDAFRAAGVIGADSSLRVLGLQVDAVDVLMAEVRGGDDGAEGEHSEPRRLVLIEDKLIRNPQAKREVLAQVLDYSERAQRTWDVDRLCRCVEPKVATWLRIHGDRIDAMLAQGEFLLVIAGDDIDENLLRLARRFATGGDPLSLAELCLVSLTIYRRGEERLFVPHVVSAVERHQRQLSIRVTVQGEHGTPLRARVERDREEEATTARRGAPPTNGDVQAFLQRAKALLEPTLTAEGTLHRITSNARKSLAFWLDAEARLKIHFGGFERDAWSPIQVGLLVDSKERRQQWLERIERADSNGELPVGTEIKVEGSKRVFALKSFRWSTPKDLTPELLQETTDTLMRFYTLFHAAAQRS